ncbi:MAG: hypothetical protein JWQ81_826 [Amycolatopsis sp.]|jgi:hypothetical protein|uniref:hypothetical protein n=1 Tax=Amycolatopsis sp. TaxID=37632 RepID=UPI002625252A|nr:hypothetical protein [Amycolatopsis sp.]MCU1680087.1 hypothetical protein [Amycolatopsis sp.]
MPGSDTATRWRNAILLALADALIAGMTLGYLIRENRAVVVSHLSLISLAAVAAVSVVALLGRVVRTLDRADRQLEKILRDELRRREP